MLTVRCSRKMHVLARVVLDDDGAVFIEAPKSGRSRRHGAAGMARRRRYAEGSGTRYGCACGSVLIRDGELRHAVKDGRTELVAPVG